jgi:hypothetical protein
MPTLSRSSALPFHGLPIKNLPRLMLTTHLYLVVSLWMTGDVPLPPCMHSCSGQRHLYLYGLIKAGRSRFQNESTTQHPTAFKTCYNTARTFNTDFTQWSLFLQLLKQHCVCICCLSHACYVFAHLIFLNLITLKIFFVEYKLHYLSLCKLLQDPIVFFYVKLLSSEPPP